MPVHHDDYGSTNVLGHNYFIATKVFKAANGKIRPGDLYYRRTGFEIDNWGNKTFYLSDKVLVTRPPGCAGHDRWEWAHGQSSIELRRSVRRAKVAWNRTLARLSAANEA